MIIFIWQVRNRKLERRIHSVFPEPGRDIYELAARALGRSFMSSIDALWWLSKNGVKYITKDENYEIDA